jgi:hypothetical protein
VSALLVATTATVVAEFTLGATKTPVLLIEPAVADQVTWWLLVFVTCAENCCVLPEPRARLAGETVTATWGFAGAGFATAMLKLLRPSEVRAASATETMNVYAPATLGWPEIAPDFALRVSPGGNLPDLTAKL